MFSSLPPTKRYFLIMFLISCILLEAFTLVVYHQSKISNSSNDWVIHTYEVSRLGRVGLLDSVDLANQAQDYVLTGFLSYYSNYNTTLKSLNKDLKQLQEAIEDDDEQTKNTAPLLEKIQNLEAQTAQRIADLRNGNITVYLLRKDERASSLALGEARAAFDTFSQNQTKILDHRTRLANSEQKNYLWTLFLGGILGLGALMVANLFIFSLINKNTGAENRLRKSEELFATILNGINDGVWDYNVPNQSIYYSPSYKSMLGWDEDELKRLSLQHEVFYDYMHPANVAEAKETMRQYIAREIPTYYNVFRIRHKEGHWVWIMSRGVGIWDDKGNIRRLIGTHTDITLQKQREEELSFFIKENEQQRADLALSILKAEAASRAKDDFLATMSHEIRTPMNAVIGLARLLLETKLDTKQFEMAETLHINADILLNLINDLLDISRIESGQITLEDHPFTFRGIFKALHAMMDGQASAKGLILTMANLMDEQTYIGDPNRIQQILTNLISNAIKFTAKGQITITASGNQISPDKAEVIISVADTGIGVAQEKLTAIFEKFVQADQTISRRFGGSGLGLAISKSLAQMMGGDITVSSTPGQGSIFNLSLTLPIAIQKKAALTQTAAVVAPPTSSSRILIVEDYAPNVLVATLMLEHLGYVADIAKSGTEALERVRANKNAYTAILMDVQMQDMDGFETTRQIRLLEKEKGIRHFIIGVTAHALAGDRERCLDAGMDDYMSKPIHPDLLAEKLMLLERAA